MKNNEFRPRRHYNAVLDASQARNSERTVLQAMVFAAEFDRPEVTITRPQLAKKTRLSRNSILAALKVLKEEGSIEATRNVAGGRGNAVTYSLKVAGQGARRTTGAPAGEGETTIWDRVAAAFKEHDVSAYKVWIAAGRFQSFNSGNLIVLVKTQFLAERVQREYGDKLLGIAVMIDPCVKSVKFVAD